MLNQKLDHISNPEELTPGDPKLVISIDVSSQFLARDAVIGMETIINSIGRNITDDLFQKEFTGTFMARLSATPVMLVKNRKLEIIETDKQCRRLGKFVSGEPGDGREISFFTEVLIALLNRQTWEMARSATELYVADGLRFELELYHPEKREKNDE